MELSECEFSISNVHSIKEESTDANPAWDVNIKQEYNLDETTNEDFKCEDLSITAKSESSLVSLEEEDTLSVTEPQVEVDYSELSIQYCGLPNLEMFNTLLEYVEDEIEPMQGVTKFAQLLSVLAKLHSNQESLYLNKYIFPSTFVNVIELLYKKLKVLCKISTPRNRLPEIFVPLFSHDQQLIIVGAISLQTLDKSSVLKYLIGYSVFGEVFFVSNSFLGLTPINELIQYSGILEELQPEQQILYCRKNLLYQSLVKNIKDETLGCRLQATKIKNYITHVNGRLQQHFQILSQPVLESMLYSKGDICFLDKLIFVCCMLLNMLPRSTYY